MKFQISPIILQPLLLLILHLSIIELARPAMAFQNPVRSTTSTTIQSLSSNRISCARRQRYSQRQFLDRIVSSKPLEWTFSLRTLPTNDHRERNEEQFASDRTSRRNRRRVSNDRPSSSFVSPQLYQKEDLMKMPIAKLLSQLVQCNIRISPTATREELVELLLLEYQSLKDDEMMNREGSDNVVVENEGPNASISREVNNDDDEEFFIDDFANVDNHDKEKDANSIGKRNDETRQSESVSLSSGPTMQRNISTRQRRMDDIGRKRRNRRKRIENKRSVEDPTQLSLDKAIENMIPTVQEAETWGRKVVKKANRVAKVATNDFGKRINQVKPSLKNIREGLKDIITNKDDDDADDSHDANGVKEVDWYYVSKDDIKTQRTRPARRTVRKARKIIRRQNVPVPNGRDGIKSDDKRLRMALPERLDGVVYFPSVDRSNPMAQEDDVKSPKIVVDSNTVEEKDQIDATRRKRSSSPPSLQNRTRASSEKKIYSVYPQNDNNDNAMDLEELYGKATANAIDTVGEFLLDVISGEKSFENGTEYPKRAKDTKSAPIRRRYWKDRLAEKVDYALGVHEDGGYYKSWQEQLDRQRAMESDTRDPISIFYGNQKKRRREKKKTGPFWEEDGSLMSLFLGRNPKGREIKFHKLFERDFSVNILLKTVLKSFIAILSYVCRWASCRGALPQPIVVFVFVASALSAPKRKKVMTALLALIATRTVAEAVHGYVYGSDDWEDEDLVTSDKEPNI